MSMDKAREAFEEYLKTASKPEHFPDLQWEAWQAALQAASQSKTDGGWQKIESAPRDGTEFMAVIEGCDSGNLRIISPCKYINEGFTFDGSEISNAWTEKYWTPLPPPPLKLSKAEGG
ncbi:MAG: hypothetical protein WC091_02530 [Sulfuricellaceae bacterium]